MYSTVPTGSLVTLGGHLGVVLHSDDATASVGSADPRRHWPEAGARTRASIPSPRRVTWTDRPHHLGHESLA